VFLPNTISHIIQSKGLTWAVKWLLEIRVEKLAFTFLRECGLMIFLANTEEHTDRNKSLA
jgi:hypothetical protein